jgi:hypothetical protein
MRRHDPALLLLCRAGIKATGCVVKIESGRDARAAGGKYEGWK